MATQYVIDNADSDGTAFVVPSDQPGGEPSFEVDDIGHSKAQEWYIHIDNGWDVSADFVVRGSHQQDEDMTTPANDGTTITINAGNADFVNGTTGHSFIDLQVTPNADPASGELTVTFQTRNK